MLNVDLLKSCFLRKNKTFTKFAEQNNTLYKLSCYNYTPTMKITMLGTGNALVSEIFNTCFVISDGDKHLLVDCGGGNGILTQLRRANLDWKDMRHIFITHKHIDHLLGAIWMMRMITQFMAAGKYDGEAYIYSHQEVVEILKSQAETLLQAKQAAFIGKRLHLVSVNDGETRNIMGHDITFFDIHSTKALQYGFRMNIDNGRTLACLGDEPYNEACRKYVENADWLMHEAFCLNDDADIFKPYEKHHSTALDAGRDAEELCVKNLVLYHTEEKTLATRKQRYTEEAQKTFHGNVFVPDDLDVIDL